MLFTDLKIFATIFSDFVTSISQKIGVAFYLRTVLALIAMVLLGRQERTLMTNETYQLEEEESTTSKLLNGQVDI